MTTINTLDDFRDAPRYTTLEDVLGALASVVESESDALFAQGDVLAAACDPDTLHTLGYARQGDFLADVGAGVGLGKRALMMRLKVARTFSEDERNPELRWMTHYHAARTDNPLGWLELAAVNKWGPTAIQAAIKADKAHDDDSETIVVARARTATVISVRGDVVALRFTGAAPDVQLGEDVVVTMAVDRVQAVAPEERVA